MGDVHAGDTRPITLAEVQFARAWNVRGDAENAEFRGAVQRWCGMDLPRVANGTIFVEDRAMLSLGPRSWLWLADSAERDFESMRDALNAARGALFDVSASYAMWQVSGMTAPCILNRMCPLDLHDAAFAPGTCAQTLFGHINGIVYRPTRAPAFVVMFARSYRRDVWHHLCTSALSEGYEVTPAISLRIAHA